MRHFALIFFFLLLKFYVNFFIILFEIYLKFSVLLLYKLTFILKDWSSLFNFFLIYVYFNYYVSYIQCIKLFQFLFSKYHLYYVIHKKSFDILFQSFSLTIFREYKYVNIFFLLQIDFFHRWMMIFFTFVYFKRFLLVHFLRQVYLLYNAIVLILH